MMLYRRRGRRTAIMLERMKDLAEQTKAAGRGFGTRHFPGTILLPAVDAVTAKAVAFTNPLDGMVAT